MILTSYRTICALTAVLLVVPACGGSGPGSAPSQPSQPSPSGSAASNVVITITSDGASPRNVTVPAGSQITFVNNDSIAHLMFSDPHPEHTDCPDINQVGYLEPGQTRQTGNMNLVRTCGFHDHNLPMNASLHGTITTQ